MSDYSHCSMCGKESGLSPENETLAADGIVSNIATVLEISKNGWRVCANDGRLYCPECDALKLQTN